MNQAYDENLLLAYVEGELSGADQARVAEWLRNDPHLAVLLKRLVADREALRRMPDPPVPAWLLEEVQGQLERQALVEDPPPRPGRSTAPRRPTPLARLVFPAAIAAMFVLVGGVVIWSLVSVPEDVSIALDLEHDDRVAARDDPLAAASDDPIQTPALPDTPAPQPPDPIAATEPPPSELPPAVAAAPDADVLREPVEPQIAAQPQPEPRPGEAPDAPLAAEEQTLFARPQPPSIFAQVDARRPADLLKPPAGSAIEAEAEEIDLRDRQALDRLAAAFKARPQEARRYQLTIVTEDVQATEATLLEHGKWTVPNDANDADDARVLRLPADMAIAMIETLRIDPFHPAVRLFRGAEPPPAPVAPQEWPGEKPDYLRILIEQLPQADPPKPAVIELPVTIERAGEQR